MTGGGLRIIGGVWRGRRLVTPDGVETRPTASRARQAAFDILLHAPWADPVHELSLLDAFAGSGAFGLEFLSRGGGRVSFLENSRAALQAIKANIAACKAETLAEVIGGDVLNPRTGLPHDLVFLDPPYGQDMVRKGITALREKGWLAARALVIAELGPGDEFTPEEVLTDRKHGKARLVFGRI